MASVWVVLTIGAVSLVLAEAYLHVEMHDLV